MYNNGNYSNTFPVPNYCMANAFLVFYKFNIYFETSSIFKKNCNKHVFFPI